MSGNYSGEETARSFEYDNPAYNDAEEGFTDLQSCDLPNDTDSRTSYSNSLDHDDENNDDYDRPAIIHCSSMTKEDAVDLHKKESITTVNLPNSSTDIIDLIREDLYKFVFMPISKEFNDYVRCRLTRNKFDMFHTFRLELEHETGGGLICLLTAEKQSSVTGRTHYIISVIPKFSNECYSAELESTSVIGTSYSLYDLNGDERQQLAIILYESNFLGLKGPRKIKVLLPRCNSQRQSLFNDQDIVQYNSREETDCFIHLQSKPPDWNPHTSTYVLKFDRKDRMIQPSVKNFQMMIENNEHEEQIVMQFGRISENEFSCDFRYPLSLMQTFSIALSAFDSRLFRD